MQLKCVLFDLDGTLVDTAPDMVATLNRILQKYGQPATDYTVAKQYVSKGSIKLLQLGFGDELPKSLDALREEFLVDYEQHICDHSVVFDGIPEILDDCEKIGLKWGVITNKPYYLADALLKKLELRERTAILLGGDSLSESKPSPMPMLHTCMELSLAPSECVYIGDDERDIIAGKAAGMDTAAALWGYISNPEEIDSWQPDYILSQPASIAKLFE